MFERFTEKAIKAIMLAHEESRRISHSFVGTEQILLGLIGEETGIAAKVLKSMGVNLKNARIEVEKIIALKSMGANPKDTRIEVEKIIGQGSNFISADIPFTPRAKKVLELSLKESRQLEHNWIGTEHLLLGVVCKSGGVAPRVLENLGVNLSEIRIQVISALGEMTCKTNDNTVETKREHKSIYKCPYCSNEEKIISTPYKCQVCDNPKFILIEDIYIQRITYPN